MHRPWDLVNWPWEYGAEWDVLRDPAEKGHHYRR